MIDARTDHPMTMLDEARDRRRASLEPWRCENRLPNGQPCDRLLMNLDWNRPSFIQVKCGKCGHTNTFVEAHRSIS